MATFPALTVTAVHKEYPVGWRGSHRALAGVSFSVRPGEVVSLIGQNGAGKTTLLKIVSGLSSPSRGSVSIFQRSASDAASRQSLGFMPENPQFYPSLTAWQFLIFVGGLLNLPRSVAQERARHLLREVNLHQAGGRSIGTFSKGMRQRLGFAQACLGEPPLLLLDEPLDGLDPLGRQDLKKLIKEQQRRGTTILLCSHILSDIDELSDKIGVLHQGRLLYYGPTAGFRHQAPLEEAFVEYVTAQS